MGEMVQERRAEGKGVERYDLLSNFLDAADDLTRADGGMSDADLKGPSVRHSARVPPPPPRVTSECSTGNIFMFMLAGHEARPPFLSRFSVTRPG
jgi:hypothetical protein